MPLVVQRIPCPVHGARRDDHDGEHQGRTHGPRKPNVISRPATISVPEAIPANTRPVSSGPAFRTEASTERSAQSIQS